MDRYELTRGEDKTKVSLLAYHMGSDVIVCIYNENAHIGAVALGEYDPESQRVSTSVVTRLGHKDDILAQKAAYLVSKYSKKPVCVIAGVHIDNISKQEIDKVVQNTDSLVEEFISQLHR